MAWRHKIDLADVMLKCAEQYDLTRAEEKCPDEVKELIAAEISKALPLRRFAASLRTCKSIAEFNRVLDRVYNEADLMRVWCGI